MPSTLSRSGVRPAASAGSERSNPAWGQDRLLSGVLQIFSLIANADGDATEAEIGFVEDYLRSLHPEDTKRLMEEFRRDVAQRLEVASTVTALRDTFSYEEKLFVLGKSYEMLDSQGISDAELKTARAIAEGLGIDSVDAEILEDHLLHESPQPAPPPGTPTHVHVLRLGDQPDAAGELILPLPGLRADLFALAGGFYIRQLDDRQPITVGGRRLRRKFLTKIRRLEPLRIGGLTVRQGDLPFYLHRLAKAGQPQALFLSPVGKRSFAVAPRAPREPAALRMDFQGIAISITSPAGAAVHVNGESINPTVPRRVLLGDGVSVDGVPVNLRKLLFNHLADDFSFEAESDGTCAFACQISNKPDADLHFPDRQGKRWQASVRRGPKGALVWDAGDSPHPLTRAGRPVFSGTALEPGARYALAGFVLEVEIGTALIRRLPPGIQSYQADSISFRFPDRSVGLDRIQFEAERGDLICIMGPSGCGKSTLLSVLTGASIPTSGSVRIDGAELHRHAGLQSRIGYVPQDDLLFENLTVGENLEFSARLRFPGTEPEKVENMVRKAISEVGLRERRHVRAGGPLDKTLSGGERKRLNIGLELLGDYEILLLDEPTSGLSSGDAMKVIEVLKNRTLDGGIVFVVAHQPSAKLLEMFDKVLLLDRGGKVAFFGDVPAAFQYFHEHEEGEIAGPGGEAIALDADFLFEALERSSLRIDGTPDLARRHPPSYWQARFSKYRDLHVLARLASTSEEGAGTKGFGVAPPPPPEKTGLRGRLAQFGTLLRRETLNKLRNRFNLLVSLGSALGLAVIVALACRESSGPEYSLVFNRAYGNFLFLTTVVTLFLALSGSVTEIVKDRAIRMRERLLGIPHGLYLFSKLLPLLAVLGVQLALYVVAGLGLMGVHELWLGYWLVLGTVGFSALTLGLFFSALPAMTDKAASALIPILLVPQIILAGAEPFKFERMAHLHWPAPRPANEADAGARPPWAAQAMPSRWGYEALVVLQRDSGFFARYLRAKEELKEVLQADNIIYGAKEPSRQTPEERAELLEAERQIAASADRLRPAREIVARGEGVGPDAGLKMKDFARTFSPPGTNASGERVGNLSAPSIRAVLPGGKTVSRLALDLGVLGLMGVLWLALAWAVLAWGRKIGAWLGRRG